MNTDEKMVILPPQYNYAVSALYMQLIEKAQVVEIATLKRPEGRAPVVAASVALGSSVSIRGLKNK